MSSNLRLILEEAHKLGIKTEITSVNRLFAILSTEQTSAIVYETFCIVGPKPYSENIQLSRNKSITNFLWAKHNIPIPKSFSFNQKSLLLESAEELPYPIILKEACGGKSINIFPDIKNKSELLRSIKKVNGEKIVIQEMIYGNEYRLLMLNGKLIGALQMVHPFIDGDGKKTISQLIDAKNETIPNKILLNSKVASSLRKLGLTLASVPTKKERIFLQSNSCLSEGGHTIDCTDIVNNEIVALAAKALAAVNLGLGGIDMMCEDITQGIQGQKIVFFEVNSRPSLSIHHLPSVGKSRNVAREILKYIFNK